MSGARAECETYGSKKQIKRMTRYFPDTHDPILRHLFQCQMSDEQIGERIGVSWHTIRRNRERLNLGMPKPRGPHSKPPTEPIPPCAPEPSSPIQLAKNILGERVTERNGVYFLDGCPISAPNMVRAANRQREQWKLPQFGPEGWRI